MMKLSVSVMCRGRGTAAIFGAALVTAGLLLFIPAPAQALIPPGPSGGATTHVDSYAGPGCPQQTTYNGAYFGETYTAAASQSWHRIYGYQSACGGGFLATPTRASGPYDKVVYVFRIDALMPFGAQQGACRFRVWVPDGYANAKNALYSVGDYPDIGSPQWLGDFFVDQYDTTGYTPWRYIDGAYITVNDGDVIKVALEDNGPAGYWVAADAINLDCDMW